MVNHCSICETTMPGLHRHQLRHVLGLSLEGSRLKAENGMIFYSVSKHIFQRQLPEVQLHSPSTAWMCVLVVAAVWGECHPLELLVDIFGKSLKPISSPPAAAQLESFCKNAATYAQGFYPAHIFFSNAP